MLHWKTQKRSLLPVKPLLPTRWNTNPDISFPRNEVDFQESLKVSTALWVRETAYRGKTSNLAVAAYRGSIENLCLISTNSCYFLFFIISIWQHQTVGKEDKDFQWPGEVDCGTDLRNLAVWPTETSVCTRIIIWLVCRNSSTLRHGRQLLSA